MSILFTIGRSRFSKPPILALLVGTFALFVSACFSKTTQAQVVPGACLSDSGEPIEPLQHPGAWAIIMNFNHDPSATHTEACWAIRDDDAAMAISYTAGILCQVRNNSEQVMVGNGSAHFDGNYHITCPRRDFAPDPNTAYNSFYVHAEATFGEVEAVYPLLRHGNVSVRTRIEGPDSTGGWNATLRSRFGEAVFEDSQAVSMVADQRQRVNSVVKEGVGFHYVNRQLVNSQMMVDPFEFDYTELFFIGGGETPWELHEIVIDPPGLCNGCYN